MSSISFQTILSEIASQKADGITPTKELLVQKLHQKYAVDKFLVDEFVDKTIKLGFIKL